MAAIMACLAGEEVYRQWDAGRIAGRRLGPRKTPFGQSGEIFLVESDAQPFYLLPRYRPGIHKKTPGKINDRANMYALKDLGIHCVLAWGAGGAVSHNFAVGDLVILGDVIDRTYLRHKTFFEDSPLGFLREFPVFCPTLRRALGAVLNEMKLVYHRSGTAAVCEGPRLETPAEVRMLSAIGAEIVTHCFVPEVFLAKELELCYAAICYVVNFAETGSRHRPFKTEDLFGGLMQRSERERVNAAVGAITAIAQKTADAVRAGQNTCECNQTMAANVSQYNLPDDWRQWFV